MFDPAAVAAALKAAALKAGGRPAEDKQARKLYVGNIPPTSTTETITQVLEIAMRAAKPHAAPGDIVVSCFVNLDKKYAFAEFRSAEEATFALQTFDQLPFMGHNLKLRRPSDYRDPNADANTVLGAIGGGLMGAVGGGLAGAVQELATFTPHMLVLSGCPPQLTNDDVVSLVGVFGLTKSVEIVAGGKVLFEMVDPSVCDEATRGLNGVRIGSYQLLARRAVLQDCLRIAGSSPSPPPLPPPTTVLVMKNMVCNMTTEHNSSVISPTPFTLSPCSCRAKMS
jgi:splicing factor U2AF subunit